MPPVEWKKAAREDLWAIVDYISDEDPEAAQVVKNAIEATVGKLPQHPQMYQAGRVLGTREIVIKKKYSVVYCESPSQICILRVLHTAREYP